MPAFRLGTDESPLRSSALPIARRRPQRRAISRGPVEAFRRSGPRCAAALEYREKFVDGVPAAVEPIPLQHRFVDLFPLVGE